MKKLLEKKSIFGKTAKKNYEKNKHKGKKTKKQN
jgi:hypothetical protein